MVKSTGYLGLILIASLFSGLSNSQDLVLSSGFSFNALFNDQYDIDLPGSEAATFEYAPFLRLGYEGQTYTSDIEADVAYNYFIDSAFQNTTNAGIAWRQSKSWERSSIAFDLDFNQRRISDLDEFDDSQDISVNEGVRQVSGDITYTSQLSALTNVNIAYDINRRTSDVNDNVILTHNASVGFGKVLSPRSLFNTAFTVSFFDPDLEEEAFDISAKTYGINVGGQYQLGENWSLNGAVGVSVLKYDLASGNIQIQDESIEDGDPNLIADISAQYQGRLNTLNLSLQSGVFQQLDGFVESQQTISLNWTRQYTPYLTGGFLISGMQSDRNGRQDIFLDGYLSLTASDRLIYRLTYGYNQREIDSTLMDLGESNSSNQVSVAIEYSLQDRRL